MAVITILKNEQITIWYYRIRKSFITSCTNIRMDSHSVMP
jgi:hypothetical protein